MRVVITDETAPNKNYGGISYTGSFTWNSDTPSYVYANRLADNAKYIADAAAHEAGHSLGLGHDGQGTSAYYYGHGSGATDWAPVMGVGYYGKIVQWSKGEYYGATNTQDDLAIIASKVGYRADDYGSTFTTAASLGGTVAGGVATVQTYGIISGSGAQNDVDMFAFKVAAGGSINMGVSAWTRAYASGSATPVYSPSPSTMLDASLKLYGPDHALVAVSDDPTRLDAALSLSNLAGGTYYLAVDGVGWGNPMAATPTGYTEYGSLGQYMIRGTYTADSVLV